MVFGGRRAKTAPLVYQSRNWQHGVFVGAIMASETTAAQAGAGGVVRRDPMAMLPFCGYNMGDYWQHWLDMGDKIKKQPKIFNVNWFRLDDNGNFIWPGYGENFRVIDWIIKRCNEEIGAKDAEIGFLPNPEDIDITGLDYEICPGKKFGVKDLEGILKVEAGYWKDDVASIKDFFAQFGDRLPKVLAGELAELERKLG
jgi:phosphoenolpyruvate carboxykinase (GTP)